MRRLLKVGRHHQSEEDQLSNRLRMVAISTLFVRKPFLNAVQTCGERRFPRFWVVAIDTEPVGHLSLSGASLFRVYASFK